MMKLKAFGRTLLTTGIVVGLGFSQAVLATQDDQDDVITQVELVVAFSLACGVLRFGQINLDLEAKGTNTTELTVEPTTTGAANFTGTPPTWAVVSGTSAAGACSVFGFTEPNIEIEATAPNGGALNLTGVTSGSSAPGDPLNDGEVSVVLSISDHNSNDLGAFDAPKTVFSGDVSNLSFITFRLGGTLTIDPSGTPLNSNNFGKYDGTIEITVEELVNSGP